MSLSVLARSSGLRQQTLVRGFHASKAARSAHGDYHVRDALLLHDRLPILTSRLAPSFPMARTEKARLRNQSRSILSLRFLYSFHCRCVPTVRAFNSCLLVGHPNYSNSQKAGGSD